MACGGPFRTRPRRWGRTLEPLEYHADDRIRRPAPLFVVLNTGSGHGDPTEACQTIAGVLAGAGREHRLWRAGDGRQVARMAAEAVAEARTRGGAVVAAGGDGTLNTVAQAVLGSGCPFGVLPQGTFNYFGRTHGIPTDTARALRLLLDARPWPVPVGLVNDRVFLVNASLGLYPELLEEREAYKRRYGRSRWVALWAGLMALLREHRPLRVRIEHRGSAHELRTLTLFVGNNRLQLEQVGLPEAAAVEGGELAATILKPVGSLALLRLLLDGARGRLDTADHIASFTFRELAITRNRAASRRKMKVAMDGEVAWMEPPLRFRVAPAPLLLLKPEPPPGGPPPDPDP